LQQLLVDGGRRHHQSAIILGSELELALSRESCILFANATQTRQMATTAGLTITAANMAINHASHNIL